MTDEIITMDAMAIEYELPGPPYHPADFLLAQSYHEQRMSYIRNVDINEWVQEQMTNHP